MRQQSIYVAKEAAMTAEEEEAAKEKLIAEEKTEITEQLEQMFLL